MMLRKRGIEHNDQDMGHAKLFTTNIDKEAFNDMYDNFAKEVRSIEES